ncbi:hypothetical protein [Nocardia terpenica]|nr:hypothetical protein [Nocardia terpenica]
MNDIAAQDVCRIENPVGTFTDGDFAKLLADKWPVVAALLTG